MANKTFNGRIVHKHDIEANWKLAVNFIPKQGELIIYDIDENYSYERMKIGDGQTVVSSLPFIKTSQAADADTVDGKHAEDFALAADLSTISSLVGDTAVETQISTAMSQVTDIIYQDSDDHINIDRVSEDYMNSNLKITGRDIIFTDYAMDEYPIVSTLNNKADKGHKHSAADITSGTLPISRGGTNATTAADARTNLGVYSKDEHKWTKIYDSGEITSAVNAFASINISGYRKLMVAVKCVNDGTARSSKQGSITFVSSTGTKYQFPVWTSMFTNTDETTGNMGWFEITDGWLICSNASRNIETSSFLSNTEGGTADNLAGIGGGMMKCTKTLSSIMISALDQDEDRYFDVGSRVIVWGGNA